MKKSFGSRLKFLRGTSSQDEIASVFGIKQTTYSGWENDNRKPDLNEICAICGHYGVSADWLLGLSDAASARPVAAPDAPSAGSDTYWRDLVASQQAAIRDLAAALAAAQRPSTQPAVPALSGGRSVTKTA